MASKALQLFKEYQTVIVAWALLIKLMATGLTLVDCATGLVILLSLHAGKVIAYYFPKQPDLFEELKVMSIKFDAIETRNEKLERDVSALKIGNIRQR